MKKLAFALIGASSLVATASAEVIYDAIYTNASQTTFQTLTDTGSTPRTFKADFFSVANYTGINDRYNITGLSFWQINWTNALTANVKADITIYQNASGATSGTTAAFDTPLYSATVDFGTQVMAANTGYLRNVDLTGAGIVFNQPNGHLYGISIRTRADNVENTLVTPGLVNDTTGLSAPVNYVGASPNGWYRDADSSGTFTGADYRTFASPSMSNLGIHLEGTAVPEPTSMIALAVGACGLLARRRRAK
ncbi:MAG: PEP-CTERM sorting domain-containing protein [Fimbriimonadaceae bacterium]|nr:PEP-CTERM sorting domain-containing protein [Fimbriimonadaceae bacterium]